MAYRAHVQVFDPRTQKRVSPESVLRMTQLPYGRKGTRAGRPGFWIESDRKSDFVYKTLRTFRHLKEVVGYQVEVAVTNHPSYEALKPVNLGIYPRRG